ncbi:porin family protein [Vibrio sp.]|uniref:porin family protein n=1 Tax=Vibrio sp. TaxID=678 RepID=UPI003D0E4100
MKTYLITATALLALLGSQANAADFSGPYVGAGYGLTQAFEDDGIAGNTDTSGTSYGVYGGYYFNRIVGIEAGYNDYGTVTSHGAELFAPTSWSLAANLGYSFDNGLRPFALVGLSYVDLNSSNAAVIDDSGAGVHLGFGVEYQPVEHFTLRLISQADAISVDKVNLTGSNEYTVGFSSLQLGVAYAF